MRETKDNDRRKVEQKAERNYMRDVWDGVKVITVYITKARAVEGTKERANNLNDFFTWFSQLISPRPPPHSSHLSLLPYRP